MKLLLQRSVNTEHSLPLVMANAFASSSWFLAGDSKLRASGGKSRLCQRREKKCVSKRCRPRMATLPFDEIPDFVKKLDDLELRRRAKITMNPPQPVSEEFVNKLRAVIPEISLLEDALNKVPLEFDVNNHKFYSWAYIKNRPWSPNLFFIIVSGVAMYAVCRELIRHALSKYSVATMAGAAITVDFWATVSLGCIIPLILLAMVKGRENGRDAILRSLAIFLCSTLLLFPATVLASTGAVRAALLSSAIVRCVPIPMSLWLWKDLRSDIERSDAKEAQFFKAWRLLATLMVCAFGSVLRLLVLSSSSKNDFFYFMCNNSVPIRLFLGHQFPVALSLLRDVGGLQFAVALCYGACFFYGLHVVCVATDFLQTRDHREIRTLFAQLLTRLGFYDDSVMTGSRRFVSTAPPGVESYYPSSVMLLQQVEGLLGRDSALVVSEERPAILDLLESEKGLMEQKNAKEWMPSRTEYMLPNDNRSFDKIRFDSLATWARPLSEEQKNMPFTQFFETLEEDEFTYDADTDQWNFMDALSDPNVIKEEFSLTNDDEFEAFKNKLRPGDGDEDEYRTVFV